MMSSPSAIPWADFAAEAPDLAVTGRARLHGRIAYLATVRKDGTPRVHPVTPIVAENELFLFMEPTSPKGRDLRAGSGFALHCGVEDSEGGQGEFFISGEADLIEDAAVRAEAVAAAAYEPEARYILFRLRLREALATTYSDEGPVRVRWRSAPHAPVGPSTS